ncbi:MAG TPA: TonB family protein [Polyangia bacterium]
MTRRPHLRGRLGRGALMALLAHGALLAPILVLTFVYAAREEAQRAEEVDVAFRDVSPDELPADLPPMDDLTQPPPQLTDRLPPKKQKPKDKDKQKQPDKNKQAKTPPPKPEPEVKIPPLPPMPKETPPPPPPPEQRKAHEKMVDLDNDKDVPPPKDAKFLAQKNSRAAVETRATDTNLEKAQKGGEASNAPSERQDQEIGDDKAKIADLDETKSAEGKHAPEVTPHLNPELSQEKPQPSREKSLLALRDPAPRNHELTPETVDPSLPRTADGDIAMPRNQSMRGPPKDSSALSKGKRMKLALTGKDFDYLFGADAEAERRLAQKERSQKLGKFAKRQARMKSALENFIPEVKPGNQTALNARAAPFAAYIARMHRSIHRLWGFGQLEDWDEKPGSNPFNNQDLLTTLEMVLNGDGTVDKITIVRGSGFTAYDVAAIDVAYSAGPYPDPPREIRSANGKIYIHWRFYRDGRQCATSGVDYYILNNPPAGGDKGAAVADNDPPGDRKASAGGGAGAGEHGHPSAGGESAEEEGPRRLERGNPASASGAQRKSGSRGVGGGDEPPVNFPRADDAAARRTAEAWFAALGRGDVAAMAGAASFPFRSTGGVAASSREQLTSMLTSLVDESSRRSGDSVQIHTGASLRGVLGKLPTGIDDDTGGLFAVSALSKTETLILVLSQKPNGGWSVSGLVRR